MAKLKARKGLNASIDSACKKLLAKIPRCVTVNYVTDETCVATPKTFLLDFAMVAINVMKALFRFSMKTNSLEPRNSVILFTFRSKVVACTLC